MRRFLFTVTLLFTTLAVQAQTPVVDFIIPDSGPASGGTQVTIHGRNLSTQIICLLPCPTLVYFGETQVEALQQSDNVLIVVAPAHVPGPVDVTLEIPGRPIVTVSGAFTFTLDAESGYEQVLLPVYLPDASPGANGTQWQTDFRIRNQGSEAVRLAPWACAFNMGCPAVFPLTFTLEPRRSLHNPPDFATDHRNNVSQLLYISKPGAVAMNLRVADVAHGTLNGGTELPVVRAHELRSGRTDLFNIPLSATNFRVLLRVYDVVNTNSEFVVNLYAEDDDLATPIHTAVVHVSTPQTGAFRSEAAYGQLDISGLLALRKEWPPAVRMEVIPATAGSGYWAMASITNNETQLVTLVTPQ